jgi:hypothetical protein
LSTVVGWITKLVEWLTTAMGKIGEFLDKLNPLQGIKLPSLPFGNAAAAGGLVAGTQAAGAAGGGSIVVNVYTTGDSIAAEQAVVRALRRVTRINGGSLRDR